jgi:hypothetical protein
VADKKEHKSPIVGESYIEFKKEMDPVTMVQLLLHRILVWAGFLDAGIIPAVAINEEHDVFTVDISCIE